MKKVEVDKNVCIGCGACISVAPNVFEFDSDGLSKAKSELIEGEESNAKNAEECCPTGAIKVSDEEDKKEDSQN